MSNVVSVQPWGTIDINTETAVILVREDWFYIWHTDPGVKPFTIQQRRAFHHRLDREIWGKWSWQFHVRPQGAAPFAQRFAGRTLVINFDIRWVLHRGQWQVEVVRVAPGTKMNANTRSNVTFETRQIQLFTLLFKPYTAANDAGEQRPGFRTAPHEFGHTLHYPDDYLANSPFLHDTNSIMNIGQQLRQRHIALVIETLNTMIPGVTFTF